MKPIKWSLMTVALLLFMRCSGPKVIAFTGNDPDFGSYFTYRIKHPGSPVQKDSESEIFYKKVEEAIDNQMDAKGYENTVVADIVVSYNLILQNEVDYRQNSTSRYNNPYGYNPYGYPSWIEREEYTKGTLLVELREDLSRKLIWQASLDLKYNQRSSSKKKADPVENAFQIIFSNYPYIAGSDTLQNPENQ